MNTKELADALAQLTDAEVCQVGRELSRNGSFGRVAGLIVTWQYPPPDEVWRRFVVNVERPAMNAARPEIDRLMCRELDLDFKRRNHG